MDAPDDFGEFGEVALEVLYPALVVKPVLGTGSITIPTLCVACKKRFLSNCESSQLCVNVSEARARSMKS